MNIDSPHRILFVSAVSFLAGIVFASIGVPFLYSLIPAALTFAAFFASGARFRIALTVALLFLAGSFRSALDDYGYRETIARNAGREEAEGVVVSDPVRKVSTQSFRLKTASGKLLVETGVTPRISYGDAASLKGEIRAPLTDSYGRYLAKERIVGTMHYPALERRSSGNGSPVIALLIDIKREVRNVYARFLAPAEAALLSGLTLGTNEDFPKAFLDNLSLSGTRHLTAISGFNISLITVAVFGICIYLLPRRFAFIAAFIVVSCFTALVGFSASAVRAALMAFIAGLARETGRPYAPGNALAVTAAAFAFINPKVPVYDVGFQLSFLAVIGIVYLAPVLKRLFRLKSDALRATLSAQLTTAPVLIAQFQNFSLTAFIGNILILGFIPLITVLGFLLAFSAPLFAPLAALIAAVTAPLLAFVIFVINTSAHLAVPFNPQLGLAGIIVYYGFLVAMMRKFYKPYEITN